MRTIHSSTYADRNDGGGGFGILALLVFCLVWFALSTATHGAELDLRRLDNVTCRVEVTKTVRACEHVRALEKSGGTGTLVAPNRVLTCAHLFDGGRVSVRFNDGRTTPAKLVAIDRKADFALVEFDGLSFVEPARCSLNWRRGCDLIVCGYGPYPGDNFQTVYGAMDRWTDAVKGRHSFYLKTVTRDGDSGGGVFNSAGELVAVLWGCGEQSCASSGEPLRKFLTSNGVYCK